MSKALGGLRPVSVLLLLIVPIIAAGEWRRQSLRVPLVAEHERTLEIRQTVLSLERELLIARVEAGAAPHRQGGPPAP